MIGPNKIVYEETDSQQQDSHPLSSISKKNINKNGDKEIQEYFSQDNQNTSSKSFYELGIPADAFAVLNGHKKAVTCMQVEPNGHRMATGSLDYHVRLWDFHGMNTNMNSFRIIEPFTGNPIRNVHFNKTGSHLMVVCGGKQVAMLDRDGAKSVFTVKGYMYVKDLTKTKGHTNTIYDGHFHPVNANQFATCSGDGSIRLWDLEQKLEGIQKELAHKTILNCKDQKTLRTGVTGLGYTNDAKMIFGGCMDGSLQGFSTKHNLHRPEILIRNAHRPQEEYSSILSYPDSSKIVSRNTDGTMKVWDLRKYEKPYVHYSNLPNYFPGSKMCWSPDYSLLVVGTSIGKEVDEKQSYVHFFDPTTFNKLKTINMGTTSVNALSWSPVINQILVGTSDGQAKIYFDERISKKGALKCINKQPRVQKDPKFDYSHPVYNPHSLPIYKEKVTNNWGKDQKAMRNDPVRSAKPHLPAQGPNKGGITMTAYTPIHHMINMLNQNLEKVDDARKPLWEIAKRSEKLGPEYTMAYELTQPKPIFNDKPIQTKQFELLQKIQKICPHCGLKLCTCARKHILDSQQEDDGEDRNKAWK